ncbi:MAG: competence/damage-inducible protein A [Alphaproteobacteria bacterium]
MKNLITAKILVIGNEILSGRTQDLNVAYLATELTKLGISLTEVRMIPDIEKEIIDNVNELRNEATYIFTTGGIGPTHDDITSSSIAKAFGVELIKHPEAVKLLESHYVNEDLNEARLRMAHVPEGAILLENPISKAPGFCIENVYVLPGVPKIMQAMFQVFKDNLIKGEVIHSRSITILVREGEIATKFAELQAKWPNVDMGSYPFSRDSIWGTELVLRSACIKELEQSYDELKNMLTGLNIKIDNL